MHVCLCVLETVVASNTAISPAVVSISKTKIGMDIIDIWMNTSAASCNNFGSTALTLSSHTRAIITSTAYQSISPPCNLFLMLSLTLSLLPSIHLHHARWSARSRCPSSRIAKRPLRSSSEQEQTAFPEQRR